VTREGFAITPTLDPTFVLHGHKSPNSATTIARKPCGGVGQVVEKQ
jgi:hypothetical protein